MPLPPSACLSLTFALAAQGLTPEQKQSVAASLGYSETVFVQVLPPPALGAAESGYFDGDDTAPRAAGGLAEELAAAMAAPSLALE
jgi:hypothetical protein